MKPFLIILFVIGLISSCKDENSTDSSIKEQRLADKAHNSSIIEGLGNIDILHHYATNQENIPIISLTIKNDKLVYYGSTDQDGAPYRLNGFTWYESSTKNEFYLKIDRENHRLIMESSNGNKVILEIALVNDSLFSISGFEINNVLKEKKELFEIYHTSQSFLKKGNLQTAINAEGDDLDQRIRDIEKTALTTTHDYGFLNTLTELDASIKDGSIITDHEDEINRIIQNIKKGMEAASKINKSLSYLTKTVVNFFLEPVTFPIELYNIYKILDLYELRSIDGIQQSISFGETPQPLVAYLTFDGNPARNQSVAYEVSINGDAKTFYTSSDSNGIVTIELGATKVEAEVTGAKEILVKVYKGGFINKSTTFQIQLKKRPRISLLLDNSTNNQEGMVNEELKLPLKVEVRDENGKAVYGVDISWTDLTGLGLSSSQTHTNFGGESTNTWKMSSKEGRHKAIANIVENIEYVIASGMVEFSANAKKAMFEVTLYNSLDGHCDYSGQSLDYYVDGKYILTIGAGSSSTIILSEGNHFMLAKNSNWSGFGVTVIVTADVSSNWFWTGCLDGTRPDQKKSAVLNNSTEYGGTGMQ